MKNAGIIRAFAGLVLFASLSWGAPAASSSTAPATPSLATPVEVAPVVTTNIPKEVSSLGSLVAIQQVTISPEVDGRIAKILFKNGQKVAKGMPIIQLDDTQATAEYQKAVTALQLSRKNYQRAQQAGDAMSKQQLQELNAKMLSDQADLQSKQAILNEQEIRAPFSGVLSAFKINQGDFISKGTAIVSLVNTDRLQVNYSLGEDLFSQLKKGQLSVVIANAYPNKVFYATVSYISPTIDQDTRTVAIQASLSNDDNLLRPGMFVQVAQQLAMQESALVVPEEAVSADVKGYYVYKVVGNKASKTVVTIGTRTKSQVQITSGLHAGDSVVTAGQQKLNDGSIIKIMPSGSVASDADASN